MRLLPVWANYVGRRLLARNWSPTRRQQIVEDMKPILCRCGTYLQIVRDHRKKRPMRGIVRRRMGTAV